MVDTINLPEVGPDTDVLEDVTPSVPEQIEMPFIPASQRRLVKPDVDDTVVVIGQARQKKRKRSRNQVNQDSTGIKVTSHDEESSKLEDEEEEPFDYNSVPNILDNSTEHIASGPIRKQRRKGAS